MNRKALAEKYIKGRGAEIGAFHNPWPNPDGAEMIYVDRYSKADLLKQHPEFAPASIPETGIIADGFSQWAPDNHFDFILNSHVIEHTYDPIAALRNWTAMLKPGGRLVMAVPDKAECFDRDRRLTSYDMLAGATLGFKVSQYVEWATKLDKLSGDALRDRIQKLVDNDDHIHFCVWDEPTARDFFNRVCGQLGAVLEVFQKVGGEFFVVIQKG